MIDGSDEEVNLKKDKLLNKIPPYEYKIKSKFIIINYY